MNCALCNTRFNMLTFLGLLLVLVAASGHKKVDIQVAFGDSILLPCPCLKRDMARDVSWQTTIQGEQIKNILSYKANVTKHSEGYKDRAEIFLTSDTYNCSLLLTNITKDDQGEYKCNFYNRLYNYTEFNLTVLVSYTVCQRALPVMEGTSERVRTFQCDVTGRSPGALVHWKLYGERLPSSRVWNVSNGLYHLSSNLTRELNGTEPMCVVEHQKYPQLYLTNNTCNTNTPPTATPGQDEVRQQRTESVIAISSSVVVVIIIIVIFLLALYVFLYRPRAKRDTEKKRRERRGEGENGSKLIEQSPSEHINSDSLIQSSV